MSKRKSKRHVGTTTENVQHFQEETVEMSQSPVFHIHIHVPAESTQNASKIYLPRIQPVIHLHYDELAKQLGKRNLREKKRMSGSYVREMVSQGIPKFGNILFHYNNDKSLRNDSNDEERISSTPKRVMRSRTKSVNDLKKVGEKNICEVSESEKSGKSNGDSFSNSRDDSSTESRDFDLKESSSDRSNASMRTDSSNQIYHNNRPIRLKEAVVVLKDICKLKECSNLSMDRSKTEETDTVGSCVRNKVDNSEAGKKVECDSSFSRSDSPESRENLPNVNDPSGRDRDDGNGKSLTLLLEGCNFSEILKRFGRKNSQCEAKSLINSNYSTKKKTVLKTESEESTEKENGENNLETGLNVREDNSQSGDKVDKTEKEGEESEKNFTITQMESNEIVRKLSVNKLESEFEYFQQDSDNYNSEGKIKVFENENTITNNDKFSIVTSNSENNETETKYNLMPEIIEDYGAVEFERNEKFENIVLKSEFEFPNMNEESISISNENENENENENFEFETKEENTMKQQSTNEKEKGKRTLKNDSNNSSPAKKTKSMEKSEKSIKNEVSEDYIPLKSSGPTKFSVAPLASVQPYKVHNAKTFKKDMLFGNRVNRFNNSNQLKIYKMKKQAAGRRCDE